MCSPGPDGVEEEGGVGEGWGGVGIGGCHVPILS